ncbi:hypothetical protein R1flu_002651 [Riccia fluitans]|uniref:Bifunctional inhibitor/plant lipid transfer protein/seed storage helical domain-containing protein n=1 Tax=Riccia fluitans TaxID=41844 RepID=A0ABD1Y6R1_9MARC
MERRKLLILVLVGIALTTTEQASGALYKVDQCERNGFHFSKIRQPCDEFADSSFANAKAMGLCCQLLRKLHDPKYGHVQCYCQLAPTGTGLFADIAAKCNLQRNLQTCHG